MTAMFSRKQILLQRHKGAIVFNLQPAENFDKLSRKFTFFQTLRATFNLKLTTCKLEELQLVHCYPLHVLHESSM